MSLHPIHPLLLLGLLLTACQAGVTGHGVPRHYHQRMDSASSACQQNPAYCAKVAGEEVIVPTSTLHTLATAGGAVTTAVKVLNSTLRTDIEQALTQCANAARSDVLSKHFNDRTPTPQECNEEIRVDGCTLTRAMWLGNLMHDAAFACVKEQLNLLRPGGFTLQPRYRYDPRSGKTSLIPPEEVKRLLDAGLHAQLRGTLEPDIVLHKGDALKAEAVYDFKFPCADLDRPPEWRSYPPGHPHHRLSQDKMYKKFLNVTPKRVAPWLGILP
jgi:hypothetical protein